ncbi:helix-turn-helix transcriptional regulator [Pseudonocardia endophytica]|uniref:Regulatory LuxR family protein n=1 Tax=Pseudonocardia endophytica TaxID=401976 RepID=A0A4R1I1E3_PSEEN|nr:helix-turn-helix transcriptional regulator [Pseudonocardia endophytica]TCK27751.1 regulatory LuxR family protein [Pseudonocardia endophytica]
MNGVDVHLGDPPDDLPADTALVVDDAHLLDDAAVERVRRRAAEPGARVVVARRPWPRSAAVARLGTLLASEQAPVVLGALDQAGVAARAARALGRRPAPWFARRVHERTLGSPWLTDRLIRALLSTPDRARFVDDGANEDPGPSRGLSDALTEEIADVVDAEDRRVAELVLAVALGAPADAEVLGPLLGLVDAAGSGVDELDELVARAWAAGLCGQDGTPLPLVADVVRRRTAPARRTEVRRLLAEIELDRGGSVLSVARSMVGGGATGDRAAAVFTAAADEGAREEQDDTAVLYAEAVRAGAPPLSLAARRAEAHLRAGDLDGALEHSDSVLGALDAVEPTDALRAGGVAAAVLARRGLLARSAELYRWMAAVSEGSAPTAAVPVLIGTGALGEARAALGPPAVVPGAPPRGLLGSPTLLAGAEELIARGVLDSVEGSPTASLSGLARASALLESAHRAALLPDTPAALAALVAVHTGEFDVAGSVLERALAVGLGGHRAQTRHRLLLGWIALLRGATRAAGAQLAAVDGTGEELEARDEFLAASLQVALARRGGDLGALMRSWTRAREAIVRHPVDLFVLQPLGELVTAATRLREQSWVRPHLDEADALLDALGRPALWSAPLHWAQLQAAVLVADADAAARHTEALAGAAGGSRFAAAMATAAPHWVALLAGRVDAEAVEAAARGLHAVGLSWDGGKLAGQAAIRTEDRRAMTALLGCARALQAEVGRTEEDPPPAAPATAGSSPAGSSTSDRPAAPTPPTTSVLSDREREVAELVVQGRTYKEIGETLFISAKTVEHHVARMRQRLGVTGRGELHAQLRRILSG